MNMYLYFYTFIYWASPMAQLVENPPVMQETQKITGLIPRLGKSRGWRSLAGYSPWGSQRVRHD